MLVGEGRSGTGVTGRRQSHGRDSRANLSGRLERQPAAIGGPSSAKKRTEHSNSAGKEGESR